MMIILGDIASPSEEHSKLLGEFFQRHSSVFAQHSIVGNLEGLVSAHAGNVNTPVLYNDPSIIPVLKNSKFVGVGLANNHTLDLPTCFEETQKNLKEAGIKFGGAGLSKGAAETPFVFNESERRIAVFNFCWDFLLYHQANPSNGVFIAEINEKKLINDVADYKRCNQDTEVVIYLHWSFDLEIYPFPMYRQFANLLIDAGATIVAGCHSHCVQGGEAYKNGIIVYGLGNFFIPNNIFADGKLRFPEMSKIQLALEYNFEKREAKCHWFEYDELCSEPIRYLESENFMDSKLLAQYSPYSSMKPEAYLRFFKQNRRKKLLVPIYNDINSNISNKLFTRWLKIRATFLRTLAKYNIRSWQN
jgi:hypothetical protein